MVAAVGDRPYALVNLARTLLADQNDYRGAADLYRKALSLAPEDPKLRAICREFLSRHVGNWYFTMVQDHRRHRLYDEAFRRAIRPGDRVLDIGAGTGLFAMMAARAGAHEVIACERDPIVAETARQIVAQNGFSDVVRILDKDSRELVLGADLIEQADVLVWDNLANNLIGAGGLETVDDAKKRLLKPAARLIPFAAEIKVALAETGGFEKMAEVEGFDLSLFDRLRRTSTRHPKKVERRSEPATLFSFDFTSNPPVEARETEISVRTTGGPVNAIAQWLRFRLFDDIRYDTDELDVMAFGVEAHPVDPFDSAPGGRALIGGRHDHGRLWLWLRDG